MAVITFSRQYGSGGDEVAERVREGLGYRYFDKRLMAQVASDMGLSEREIVDFTEADYEVRGFFDRLFGRRSPRVVAEVSTWRQSISGARDVQMEQLDEEWCIRMVKSTVRGACQRGDVVIVGRGGQTILQDMPGVLHVRVEAPLSERIARVQEQQGLSAKEAQDLIQDRDRAAEAYLKHFHGVDWSDSTLYHLVVNTGKWGIQQAADVVVNALHRLPAVGSTASVGQEAAAA
jgi:cytidylate kinase